MQTLVLIIFSEHRINTHIIMLMSWIRTTQRLVQTETHNIVTKSNTLPTHYIISLVLCLVLLRTWMILIWPLLLYAYTVSQQKPKESNEATHYLTHVESMIDAFAGHIFHLLLNQHGNQSDSPFKMLKNVMIPHTTSIMHIVVIRHV